MDCFFNLSIPSSSPSLVIIRPCTRTFVSGLASSYEEGFPEELRGLMEEVEFRNIMSDLNDVLINYWPCFFMFFIHVCFHRRREGRG